MSKFSKAVPPAFRIGAALAGVAALVLVGLLISNLLTAPAKYKAEAGTAVAAGAVAGGEAKIDKATAGAVADFGDRRVSRAQIGQENSHAILSRPGAALGVDAGVADAWVRSLCRRTALLDDPSCLRLREADSAAASRGN